ncbi:MAG: nucleolar complex protein 14 [Bogoriella megaspora]|nr:MAG: nucleolar complex protein 14 [Bogoriella megaspora]
MPASQLKRLKASLREQGVTGPQKSKKQKKQARNGANADRRVQRNAALEGIRENFNPFEIKAATRPRKFEVTTNQPGKNRNGKVVLGRPGVTKSVGEEARRRMLLPEMQRRNRVGGIVDRRIGENDPTMTPEERALQRFTREKQKKKGSLFDLEGADDEEQLTHMGQSLSFSGAGGQDDFDEGDSGLSSGEESGSDMGGILRKRKREDGESDADAGSIEQEEIPERKKSKAEVMQEVIAKSKLHKYERQQAKEEDDILREQLDKGLPDVLAELKGKISQKAVPAPAPKQIPANSEIAMNPQRAAMMNGATREQVEKQYDEQLRQMAQDRRAAPTERTKTEEEKAVEEAARLKELEAQRLRRMKGDKAESDDEVDEQAASADQEDEDVPDDAAEFGFTAPQNGQKQQLVLDEEDEFLLDSDLVETDSDADPDLSGDEEWATAEEEPGLEEEDDFTQGLLSKEEMSRPEFAGLKSGASSKPILDGEVAYTYPCPASHAELLDVLRDIPSAEVPIVIRRIRTLYHPQLHEDNKSKLKDFSVALVDHIGYTAQEGQSLSVIETIIRHVHSLSRTYPENIANAFRKHLEIMRQKSLPDPGDLATLTAIGTIFPTSDHFHQVVTPAITIMAQWLGLACVTESALKTEVNTGAYLVALCVKYQQLSKRYIPEAINYTLTVLRKTKATSSEIEPHVQNLISMADLWSSFPSFPEIFQPTLPILKSLKQNKAMNHINILIQSSLHSRRPLELHHHRPIAIKTAIPRFEESFDPTKHYDPDRERAESQKLKKEYKKEHKGAMRELRKDANFIAREKLKEKRKRDEEYEKKYRRLVAEIQGEEGREAKEYEREKRLRKAKR